MLREALLYLTTPCATPFREMGYLKETIATDARLRRCRTAWQPHLQRTRAVIAQAAEQATQRETAVVLGAGMLADIPLDVLSQTFARVILVDVCFLRTTRKAAARHANVALQTHDITGVARAVHTGGMPSPAMPDGPVLAEAGLVVSANVLSQLPLIPLQVLRARNPAFDEAARTRFARDIVRHHLAYLETCPGVRCLITEVERQCRDADRVLETEDPLMGVAPDRDGEEWIWELAPRYEVSPDFTVLNRVRGMVWGGDA